MYNQYTQAFYCDIADTSLRSAEIIGREVLQLLGNVQSLIDVGCGLGTWAAAFHKLGVPDVWGVDNVFMDQSDVLIPRDRLIIKNLEAALDLDRTFDLAICLEVAEHLSPTRAHSFVRDLCTLAPLVLFSAAIPGQPGVHHINMRWQSYWADLFGQCGFGCWDCIRNRVWNNPEICYWYRQNSLLFVHNKHVLWSHCSAESPLDLIHPELYNSKLASLENPSLKQLCRLLPGSTLRFMRRVTQIK